MSSIARKLCFVFVVTAQLVLSPLHAAPADPETPSAGLEEIVVTATRRQERLQDVPISVLAFSQEKIDSQGLKNVDDLARLSPGLNFQRNGMSSAGNYNHEGSDINIRGVDSTAGTSTTGIYIDDTPIQTRHLGFGAINAFPEVFDLDRVEVLRGPQGTLFGAGAEGGVVRFLAPEPNVNKASGYMRADAAVTDGGAPSWEGGAAIGAPIIDDVLAFRVSLSYRRDGGWVDRSSYTLSPNDTALLATPVFSSVTQPNSNFSETQTARLAVKWKVNDALEIMPSIYYQRLQINDTAAYWLSLSDAQQNLFRNGNAGTNPSDDPFTLSAIRLKWDLGFASLYSNTSYYNRNQRATSDYTQYLRATWSSFPSYYADGAPGSPSPNGYQLPNTFPQPGDNGFARFRDDQRNFYQELRLSSKDTEARIAWTGGLYYSQLSENVIEFIIDPTINQEIINWTAGQNSLCFPGQECPNGLISNTPTQLAKDKQVAAFGELTFKFTETLKATAGLRVSKLNYNLTVAEDGPFIGYTENSYSSGSDNPITPKAVVSWQPDRDNLVYVSGSKGFRPGGLNVPVGGICNTSLNALGVNQVPGQFGSDNLWSYEIGSKNQFLDHTLEINASLYFIDWNKIQQNVYLPSCGEQFTANLGKARSKGGDFEVIYRPIPALTLDLTAAYTDARLTNTSCAGTLVYNIDSAACVAPGATGVPVSRPIASAGDALLGAPWAFTGAAEYHFPEWAGRLPYFRMDYQHQNAQRNLFPIQDANNALIDTTLRGPPERAQVSSARPPIPSISGAARGQEPSASRRPTATDPRRSSPRPRPAPTRAGRGRSPSRHC